MATLSTFTADPATVAPNGTVAFTATFTMSAGGTDETLTGELRDASAAVVGSVTVLLDRPGDEPDPSGLTFLVRNAAGAAVGQVLGFTGTRTSPTLYTGVWSWKAPAA